MCDRQKLYNGHYTQKGGIQSDKITLKTCRLYLTLTLFHHITYNKVVVKRYMHEHSVAI